MTNLQSHMENTCTSDTCLTYSECMGRLSALGPRSLSLLGQLPVGPCCVLRTLEASEERYLRLLDWLDQQELGLVPALPDEMRVMLGLRPLGQQARG